jgi:hypothetical protein
LWSRDGAAGGWLRSQQPTRDRKCEKGREWSALLVLTVLICWSSKESRSKGEPLQTGARWVVERTNFWHTRGFRKLQICTERRARVIDAFIVLTKAIIIVRRLIAEAWTRYRWNGRPSRQPWPIHAIS